MLSRQITHDNFMFISRRPPLLPGEAADRDRRAPGGSWGCKRPRPDGGVPTPAGIPYFDLFAPLLGRPATRVTALQRDYLGRGLDDLSVAIVFYGETPAVVEANYFTPGTWRDCVLVGERGALVADYGGAPAALHLRERGGRGGARAPPRPSGPPPGRRDRPVPSRSPRRAAPPRPRSRRTAARPRKSP